jgi:type I restriction enzyme M protein
MAAQRRDSLGMKTEHPAAEGPLKPVEVEVTEWLELILQLSLFQNSRWIFRGEGEYERNELLPKIGRNGVVREDRYTLCELEKTNFHQFKLYANSYLPRTPTDWELLAIAQHHGLPTRLLDWTRSPLAASFFALSDSEGPHECAVDDPRHDRDFADPRERSTTESESAHSSFERDGCAVIYCLRAPEPLDTSIITYPFGADYQGVMLLNPPHVHQRIISQDGVFTVFSDPKCPIEKDTTRRILVQKKDKRTFLEHLFRLGIHHAILFPDLDGISKHLSWRIQNHVGIGKYRL